jgi:hypothetical protein
VRRLRPTFFLLHALLELDGHTIVTNCLGDVAETFNALGDFNKSAELRSAKDLAVDHIAHAVRSEEALPDVGLKLLDAQA